MHWHCHKFDGLFVSCRQLIRFDKRNLFVDQVVPACDMRHYRIHISTSKLETIELSTSTYCISLMSYGLN